MDEAFSLAVGSRGVGSGTKVPQSQAMTQAPKASGQVTCAIVGEHAFEANAQTTVIAHGLEQRRADAAAGFVWTDRAETNAGVIIDGDMNVLPAGPA